MNELVSVIILNWNEPHKTIRCIDSCLGLSYCPLNIIVIDNNSTDDSVHIIKKAFPETKIIKCSSNKGYAGGNNLGIAFALKEKAKYIWILNNDTVVTKHSLSLLVKFAKTYQNISAVSPKILELHDKTTISYCGGYIDRRTFKTVNIGNNEKDNRQYNNISEVDFIPGCSILIKSSAFEMIGLFHEEYFLYYEETEWCIKSSSFGLKMYIIPEAVVYHETSSTTKKIKGKVGYYTARNKLFFIERNFCNHNFLFYLTLALGEVLTALKLLNLRLGYNILKGYIHWLIGIMGSLEDPIRIGNYFKRVKQNKTLGFKK